MSRGSSTSIAFAQFRLALEREIRMFWHLQAGLEYAGRYLEPHKTSTQRLTGFPGDARNPFKSVDVLPSEFLADIGYISSHLRENAIVSFVTVFESYLLELLERLLYPDPSLLSDSAITLEAKE